MWRSRWRRRRNRSIRMRRRRKREEVERTLEQPSKFACKGTRGIKW